MLFPCTDCEASFENYLKKSWGTQLLKNIPSFKCHECGYAAIDDNDLTAHIFLS